jgi:prepilin-type N-terminal cleavage/methylation domain-containing protein
MRKHGFTLLEALIASTIILVVLGALTVAVGAFFNGQKRVSARRDALMIAAAEISLFERPGATIEPGVTTRTELLPGRAFAVRTEIVEEGPDVRRREVPVYSPSSGEVGLQRRFFITDGGM